MTFRRSAALGAAVMVLLSTLGPPGSAQTHNYAEALQKALLFYEAQTSGRLPSDHRLEWRGDSCLRDGQDVGLDLTGGWYDAGDGVIWTGNVGFGASLLAWSVIRYRDAFIQTAQYHIAIDRIREISEYLQRIVILDAEGRVQRIFCGKGAIRHEPPDNPAPSNDRTVLAPNEVIDAIVGGAPQSYRPSYWVDAATGGADVAGAVAAALAASSIALRQYGETTRADQLLQLARKVYQWGEENPNRELVVNGVVTRKATRRITNGVEVTLADYPARIAGWTPRMIYAAAWLHRAELAAGTPGYTAGWVDKAEALYFSDLNADKRLKHWVNFATGAEQNGAYAMLAADTGRSAFVTEARNYARFWLYDRSNYTGRTTDPTVTPDGFIARGQGATWNNNALLDQAPPLLDWADSPYNTDATQKAHLVALYTGTYNAGRNECPIKQIDYILGSNSRKLSYLQGYRPAGTGYTWVRNLHHRPTMWAYGGFGTPVADKPLWNRFVAYGTLAPGPDHTDYYPQDVPLTEGSIYGHQEPIIYSGGLLTVLARNILAGGPSAGQPLPVCPEWEPRPSSYQVESFFVIAYRESATRLQVFVNNRAMFPPREINTLGFRYYFTPDGVSGSQVTCTATGLGLLPGESVAVEGPFSLGTTGHWYFEVRLVNATIVPGDYSRYQRRVQLDFAQPAGSFNMANDHSGAAIQEAATVVANIPVYDTSGGPGQWKLLGGFEPGPGYIQWRRAHFNNTWEFSPVVELIAERVGGMQGSVSANVTLQPGTARSSDYGPPESAVISWVDGEFGEKVVRIPLVDDPYDEGREYFFAVLGNLTGGAQAGLRMSARVSIEDDDYGGSPEPDGLVRVYGNDRFIANGDTVPSESNHTDFGSAMVSNLDTAVVRTFVIRNESPDTHLFLDATTPVQLTGSAAADFNVVQSPATTIPPGSQSSFMIRFLPTIGGLRGATVVIPYQMGSQTGTYSFAIQGTGTHAQPSLALSHTALRASVPPGGFVTSVVWTLFNHGQSDLTWTATLPVQYEAFSSTVPGGPEYEWIDITSPGPQQGTVITSWGASSTKRDDVVSSAIDIGFEFPFYGTRRTQLKVSTNGWLTFNTAQSNSLKNNTSLPSSNNIPMIAVWWDDLILAANQGDVYYRRVDADTFVVTWHRVSYDVQNKPVGDMSFQAILKRDGRIILQYRNVATPYDSNGYTIGIQNSSAADQAVQYAYNTRTAEEGVAIEFRPPCTGSYDPAGSSANWLALSQYSGTIAPRSSVSVTVYFDGNGLVSGSAYRARFTLSSNDPATPVVYVPVDLIVSRGYNLEAHLAQNRPWEQTSTWTPSFAFPGAHDDLQLTTAGGSLRIDGPRSINNLTLQYPDGLALVGTLTNGTGSGATLWVNGMAVLSQGMLRAGAASPRLVFRGGLRLSGGGLGFAAGSTGTIQVEDGTLIALESGTLDVLVRTSGILYAMNLGSGGLHLMGAAPMIHVESDSYVLTRRPTGPGGFRKTGAGVLVLSQSGADHEGVTDVAEGVVRLAADNALSSNSRVRLSGGTLATGGRASFAGPLEMAGDGSLDFTGGGALLFAHSAAVPWSTGTLNLVNFDPVTSSLRFGTDASGLTSSQLARIRLNGVPLPVTRLAPDGYLDLVPPAWATGHPMAAASGSDSITIRVRLNEVGTVWYVVLPGGSASPTAAQVRAGQGASGQPALRSGSIPVEAQTEQSRVITGLAAGTYDIHFVGEDYAGNLQVTSTLRAVSLSAPSALEQWRTQHFGTPENSGNAANSADPDGDGFANLLEYALGTTPTDGQHRPVLQIDLASDRLRLTFTPQIVAGLRYLVEASPDLRSWTPPVDVTAELTVGVPYTYVDTADVRTTPRRFLRLRVEEQ